MKTACDLYCGELLNESSYGGGSVKLLGIIKRVARVFCDRLYVASKRVNSKRSYVTMLYRDHEKQKPIATIIITPKTSTSMQLDCVIVITHSEQLIKNVTRALNVAKIELDINDPFSYHSSTVYCFGNCPEQTKINEIIKAIEAQLKDESTNKKQLNEGIQNTINTATGSSAAVIRLRGGGTPMINKLVQTINNLRNVLFVQRVEDNGNTIRFTFGKIGKPTINLIIQRLNRGLNYGARAFGYNVNHIVDRNDKKLQCSVALIQLTDRTGVYGYSGINTKLRTIARKGTNVSGGNVVGIELNENTIQPICEWLRKIATINSATQIANSWNALINHQHQK